MLISKGWISSPILHVVNVVADENFVLSTRSWNEDVLFWLSAHFFENSFWKMSPLCTCRLLVHRCHSGIEFSEQLQQQDLLLSFFFFSFLLQPQNKSIAENGTCGKGNLTARHPHPACLPPWARHTGHAQGWMCTGLSIAVLEGLLHFYSYKVGQKRGIYIYIFLAVPHFCWSD